MKFQLALVAMIAALLSCSSALANEALSVSEDTSRVKVKWSNVEHYADIDPGSMSQNLFNQRLFDSFERFFEQLSEDLPQGYHWQIEVLNLDLAGSVAFNRFSNNKTIRVQNRRSSFGMILSYQIFDSQGTVVAAEQNSIVKARRNERFPPSAHMSKQFAQDQFILKKWFKKVVLPGLNQ